MLSATAKNITSRMMSSGALISKVNRGGMKKKFHASALSAAMNSIGPRLKRNAASRIANR